MEAWQNDPIAAPPMADGLWHNDPIVQPPKIPDMSGVQKMAEGNLATASEPKEDGAQPPAQLPSQRLDTAMGMPVSTVLKGGDAATPAPIRGHIVDAYKNGTADNAGSFMQTALHAITPTIAGIKNYPSDVAKTYKEGIKGAGGMLLYPFVSDTSKQELLKGYELGEDTGTTASAVNQALDVEGATLGRAMGGIFAPVSAPISPIISPVIAATEPLAKQEGAPSEWAKTFPKAISAVMDVAGGLGITHVIRGGISSPKGVWDDHPGADTLKDIVGKATDTAPAAVSSDHIDQTIAKAFTDKAPKAQDFHDVAEISGADVSTLHTIYKETGVRPEQVFQDAGASPAIADDVKAGKIPEAYEHLVEPSPPLPVPEAEHLQVSRDEATRSFAVVDKDGDHIHGGFDSAEEARHYIEDKKFEAEERAAIENEPESAPATETAAIEKTQKSQTKGAIPPSELGRPTSLYTFIRNNGGIKPGGYEGGDLVSAHPELLNAKRGMNIDDMGSLAHEHGYFSERPDINQLKDVLNDTNSGREHFREADVDRVLAAEEARTARENLDPSHIEYEAHNAGIDTEKLAGETDKQHTARLLKALKELYKSSEGSVATDFYRKAVGDTIVAAEKFAGKLSGGLFEKLADGYIKTFQPELAGDKALRADAYLAKHKASLQEAENSYYRQSAQNKAAWDKRSSDDRMEWLDDHETGRWNKDYNPDHARFQALLDATFKAEKEAIGGDAEKGYKENYLPHQWEDPEGVAKYFASDAAIRKYGSDWFSKASEFRLIQEGVRAGFKLKTDNPESMLRARLMAGKSMIATMDLLKDLEGSGVAKKATAFSLDKKIAKTEKAISELQEKYKKAFDKANDPAQARAENIPPAVSKTMQLVKGRLETLEKRLEDFNKEKSDNKLSPEQMRELKDGFRVIGPDSKVWSIHQQAGPVWKNAMEMKGLWENQGVIGDAYRTYTAAKASWVALKLAASLFHPVHVAMINIASGIANAGEHLVQGGKLSELSLKDTGLDFGLNREMLKVRDHPAIQAWNTAEEARTPEQQKMVKSMVEGGFKPTLSARDTVHFRENFDKAISGVGLNNLRLLGVAMQLPGMAMKPFMEHWIPGMKAEIYLRRLQNAVERDPSLETDSGRRGEVARQIAKDTERTYGEMNSDAQFWNKNVRDAFNASFISGGWKLAQIYNARGLLQPGKIAYKFAKTGEFSKSDITYNMLHAYAYTGLTLALGGAINAVLGNPIGTAQDTVWDIVKNLVAPQTGEKNPDGSPIRLQQPAFAKEAYMLARDIHQQGLLAGIGSFVYHSTLIPSIFDTLNNRDYIGRPIISDPTDLNQWTAAGWDAISPISVTGYEKAEAKNSDVAKVAGVLGFPTAGAYMDQTPFEQKVLYTYSEQNPPKGDAYSASLKTDMKAAVAKNDVESIAKIEQKMHDAGMDSHSITNSKKAFTKPFVDIAWGKLSSQDQKRLIESASDEEKTRFRVKQ